MEKICTICQRIYRVKPHCFEKSKFCSNNCRKQHYQSSNVEIICRKCGKHFVRKSHEIKLSKKGAFCSTDCYAQRSPQQLVKCDCGKEFWVFASRAKYYHKLYCSNKCRYRYQLTGALTDTLIERNRYQKFVSQLRHSAKYLLWKKACLERDVFKCSVCTADKNLTVHHKMAMIEFVRQHGFNRQLIEADPRFFDLSNGVTLCRSCHFLVHHNSDV
jgi:hypothetical protein